MATLRHYIEERVRVYGDIIPDEFIDSFSYNLTEADLERREIRYFYVQFSKFIPVVNWMILPGCVTWCIIISGLLPWTKKDYKMLFSFVPAVLIVGVCLLSPKNGNVRYLLPAYTIVPAMIAMSFTGKTESTVLDPQPDDGSTIKIV